MEQNSLSLNKISAIIETSCYDDENHTNLNKTQMLHMHKAESHHHYLLEYKSELNMSFICINTETFVDSWTSCCSVNWHRQQGKEKRNLTHFLCDYHMEMFACELEYKPLLNILWWMVCAAFFRVAPKLAFIKQLWNILCTIRRNENIYRLKIKSIWHACECR